MKRKNILLLLIDCLRADVFSIENKMSEEEVKTMEKVLKELGYL